MSRTAQQIVPMLSYEDGVAAINWLCKVFGFSERTRMVDEQGRLSHGELSVGDDIIMLASPTPDYHGPNKHRKECQVADRWYQSPYIINGILVFVDDVESHFQHAKENGATILTEIERGGPGDRYRAEDLEGQRWMFMQKILV